jgi:NitT/TauT family transport system substrate-binding protein
MTSAMIGRRAAALCCAAATAVSLTACGDDSAPAADNPGGLETTEIRITNPANISNVPLHIALDEGYFADEGLQVQADIDLGAGSTVEAVIGHQVDMAWVNLGGALQPYSEGIDLRLVQISDHGKPGGMEVLVKKDSSAQGLTDLVGKTLAVLSPSTTCVWLVKKALLDAGQPVDAITMTEVSPPDHPVVLESGNVDATCTTDPTRTVMTSEFGARPIFDAATDADPDLRAYPVGGYVVSGEFADQNPKALAAFQRALTKAATYANANPDEVRAKLSTFTTADPEIADKVVINEYVETSDMASLTLEVQKVAEVMVETGVLREVPDINGFVLRSDGTDGS